MAKIKGVNVIAPVVPFDTADVHPSHEARYGKGGYRTVATTVERDAIPAPRREAGMLVFVTADGKAYQLGSDLTTWAEFTSGVSSWDDLEDRPTDFPPSAHSHSIGDVEDLSDALGEKVPKAGGTMDADATLTFPTAASSSEVGGWGFGVGLNVEGSAPGQYATVESTAITVVNGSGSTQLTPAGLTLQNATQLVVGSFDNSTGGSNGISLICAVGYELNWQGGRLRNVQIGGNGTPQPIFCDSTIEFTGEDGTIAITGDGIIFPDGTQTVAWTGSFSYEDLDDLPTLFDGDYNSLANRPGLFDGDYNSLSNTPSFATVATTGSYWDLNYRPPLFDGDYDSLSNKPTLGTAAAEDTTAFAAASHGHVVADITDFPALGTAAASAVEDFAAASHTHSASDITSGTLDVARLPTVLEQTVTVGNSGTSTTLSLANGSVQTVTLNGNCTFTMPTASAGASLTLILTQNGTNTATFTGVLWAGGTAPTITATANKVDILVFVSNGTSWFGSASQNH
jgi:hypothetical protein